MISKTNNHHDFFYILIPIILASVFFIPILENNCHAQSQTITLQSDKKIYQSTEEIEIKSTITNTGDEITVDQIIVYLKEGKIYFHPNWTDVISSTRLTLQKDYFKEDIIMKDFIKNHFQTGGEFTFAAALAYPDSTNIIGNIFIINIIVADSQGCPENMVRVGDKYCIDIYEASKEDATSTYTGDKSDGAAFSRVGVFPWNRATWFEAQQACIKSGKRLCTSEEWEDACDGIIGSGGKKYPYGDVFVKEKCNTNIPQATEDKVVITGSFPECLSSFGVYDMSGNLLEWTHNFRDNTIKFKSLMSGGWEDGENEVFCTQVKGDYPDNTIKSIGFRCCYPLKYDSDNFSISIDVITQRNYLYSQTNSSAYLFIENKSQETINADLIIGILDSANQLFFYPDWQKTPLWQNTTLQPMQKMLLNIPIKNDLTSGNYKIAAGLFKKLPELEQISEISIYDFVIYEKQNGYCPEDMTPVGDLYCIDKYEVSREDATSENPGEKDDGLPLSRKGFMPWANISQFEAGAACIRANKRLCTRGEWGDACDGVIGPGGWMYPYADHIDWDRKTCNRRNYDNWHFSPTGTFEACVSRFGAYDMNGNYWEWDADENGAIKNFGRRGADFSHSSNNMDKCYNIYASAFKDSKHDDISFRCCK